MKKLIRKSVLFLGTVCLCFLGLLNLQQSMEVQASTFSVNSASTLVGYCARTGTHTINLTANIDLYEIVTIDRGCNITINGNGYTITQKCPENTFKIESGGSLTISNTTIDRSLHPDSAVCFYVKAGGSLTVESGTYKASNSTVADVGVKELHGAQVVGGWGMVTINGGTFMGSMADFYAVGLCGQYNYVINGGEFTNSTSGVGINLAPHPYKEAKNSVTINGGNFHHNRNNGMTVGVPTGSQAGTTTATVNGGSFHDNGLNGISVIDVNQTCTVKSAYIYGNKQSGILAKGGKVYFTSTNANTLKIYNNVKYNVGIFGGATFTGGNADLSNTTYMDNRGIIVQGSTATVGAGTTIKNRLDGIYVDSSGTAVVNGGFISGCTRGIWVYNSTCTINNVEVNGNTTGIDADSASTLTMSAGKIVNNTTGLYVEGTGKATLAGSSGVYNGW